MEHKMLCDIIQDQTKRALWEVRNVIDCIPEKLWEKTYCEMPVWKHVYHMLHSLDLWFVNPRDKNYVEPSIHEEGLNSLDIYPTKGLTRTEINVYFDAIKEKTIGYLSELNDGVLSKKPENCEFTKFTLILAQHRHLHTHMGMIMGFIIADTGLWPRVVGLENPIPEGDQEYMKYL